MKSLLLPILANFLTDAFWELVTNGTQWFRDQIVNVFGFDIFTLDISDKIGFIVDSTRKFDDVVPLVTCIGILMAGWTVKMAIRLGRWILACIPGLALGG